MERWHRAAGVPTAKLVNPADSSQLHISRWATRSVTAALGAAIGASIGAVPAAPQPVV